MLRLFGTLLVGILSASLAVIFQNDIAAFFGRAPITAHVTVGAWYPYHLDDDGKLFRREIPGEQSPFIDDEDLNFARIVLRNRTGSEIPQVYITDDADWSDLRAVVVRQDGENLETSAAKMSGQRLLVGGIAPASKTTIYVWSRRTFSWPFNLDDIQIVATNGDVPISVTRLSGSNGSFVFGWHTETLAWAIAFILFVMAIILLVYATHYAGYFAALLRDEDYYLSERIRFEQDPAKFSAPGSFPTQ